MENKSKTDKITEVLINQDFDQDLDHKTINPETLISYRFQQYNAYLQLADKISERRQNANSFFLTANTGVCVIIAYIFSKDVAAELRPLFWCVPVAGILISYFWLQLIHSYRQLNSGKFQIVHRMEKYLPYSPYKAEWIALGEGKDKKLYYPLTHLEIWIPRLFILMYCLIILYFLIKHIG
jgi:hypothetical protein